MSREPPRAPPPLGDPVEAAPSPSDRDVDEALAESFPASDPPFWTLGMPEDRSPEDETAESVTPPPAEDREPG